MRTAQPRLEIVLGSDSLLTAIASAAYRDGLAGALPGESLLPAASLHIQHLPLRHRGDAVVVALRWTLADPTEIPPLDADLQLEPSAEDRCLLRLCGSYRAPMRADHARLAARELNAIARTTALAFLGYLVASSSSERWP